MRALGQPMTNKLLVGIVAVVIIVAAAAAAIILLNDKEKEPPAGQEYSDNQCKSTNGGNPRPYDSFDDTLASFLSEVEQMNRPAE